MRATTNGISAVRVPVGCFFSVAVAQDGFEDEADGNGQLGDRADTGFFQRGQRIELPRRAVAEFKVLQRAEQIV
jgi:hypothetical protein